MPSGPQRPSLSCTECRRRKQKCNQARPCNNCSRRFPQPICEYELTTNQRSKRSSPRSPDTFPSEFTEDHGPYSHLRFAGVQDAILQIELPSSVVDHENADSQDTLPATPRWTKGDWKLFRTTETGNATSQASKAIMQIIRKLMHHRFGVASRIVRDDWPSQEISLLQEVEASVPPPRPVERAIDELRHLPMAPTRLNKELVRTHLQLLSRFKVSIDGNPAPDNPFLRHWIPFSIQDPLLLRVVLFTAACFLQETGHVPKVLTMAYKGVVYNALNQSLSVASTQCSDAVVLAVAQLIMDEWYWGATKDLRTHMHGLQMIVRMRGGLQELGMHGYLAKLLLIHDIGIALSHETAPIIFDKPGFEFIDPVMVPLQTSLNCPLSADGPTFASCATSMQLHPCTTLILDDMRALIDSILSGLNDELELADPEKSAATASMFHRRLESMPADVYLHDESPSRQSSEDRTTEGTPSQTTSSGSPTDPGSGYGPTGKPDPVYRWVRMTASIYCRAILYRRPISAVCSEEEVTAIWQITWKLQGAKWRTSVGVTLWVFLALAPSCHPLAQARFIKTFVIMSLSTIGFDNWHVMIEMSRRILMLQMYLREGLSRGMAIYGGEKSIDRHGFAVKEWMPNMGLTTHFEDDELSE